MRTDVRAEFDRITEQMEWGDVLETLHAVIDEALGGTAKPWPPTPPPSPLPTELGCAIPPQPVGDVNEAYGGCSSYHLGIAPHSFMQAGPLHCQADVHSQGQYTNAPVISFCGSTGQNLVPLQLPNGEVVYAEILHHPYSAAPPAPTSLSKKRKKEKQHDDAQPYIKKPLNAFMLFVKEQRQNVVAEIKVKDSATVNRILGQRWASLSKEEKAQYYEKAEEEKMLHAKQNPGWSTSDNYGKKRKRQRRKAPTAAESSATTPEDVKQQTQQPAVTEAWT